MVLNRVEDMDETIEMMNKVTVKDISDCLEKYFDFNSCSISLIGDLTDYDIKTLKKNWKN